MPAAWPPAVSTMGSESEWPVNRSRFLNPSRQGRIYRFRTSGSGPPARPTSEMGDYMSGSIAPGLRTIQPRKKRLHNAAHDPESRQFPNELLDLLIEPLDEYVVVGEV